MERLFGEGLVDEVLFCYGDSLEEDLRWEPRLRAFVDLVDFEDGVTNYRRSFQRSFLLIYQRAAEDKGRWGRGSWP